MRKKMIKSKSDTSEIVQRTAERLGVKTKDVQPIIHDFWVDLGIVFNHNLGYGVYVEQFGHFLMYTKGINPTAKQLIKDITKKLRMIAAIQKRTMPHAGKIEALKHQVADLTTRYILLTYSAKQYQADVLSTYPNKYKVDLQALAANSARLEELLGVPLSAFPLTIYHPIQKVYVQNLRKEGVLTNPVVDHTHNKVR